MAGPRLGLKHTARRLGVALDTGGGQGLTLVHFSAQLKRFVWDSGCIRGYVGGI